MQHNCLHFIITVKHIVTVAFDVKATVFLFIDK